MLLGRSGLPVRLSSLLAWLTPLVVGACVLGFSAGVLGYLIGAILALAVFTWAVVRPSLALSILVVFMPLQLMGFSLLLGKVPSGILRPAGALTEVLGVAILLAGWRQLRLGGRRLDRIDKALLLYVAVVTIYLVVPHLLSNGAPQTWNTRLYAWRNDAGYPLLFFGARYAPITARLRARFLDLVVGLGVFVAAVGLYQEVAPVSWSTFVLTTAHLGVYEAKVAGIAPYLVIQELEYLFFTSPLRVSSIFGSPFDMADYLLIVVAIVAVRIRDDGRAWHNYLFLAMTIGAIYFSRVRGDAVAAAVILVLIALPGSRRQVSGRIRLLVVLALGALLIVPSLAGTRYVGAQGGSQSTSQHITELEHGIANIASHPLGLGLGAEPSDRQYLVTSTSDTSEDSFLQVVDELGILGLLPWLAMIGFVLLELRRRASGGETAAHAMGWALVAILVAGLTHHVFLTVPVPWTLWAGVGLALTRYREPSGLEPETNVPRRAAGVP